MLYIYIYYILLIFYELMYFIINYLFYYKLYKITIISEIFLKNIKFQCKSSDIEDDDELFLELITCELYTHLVMNKLLQLYI